MALNISMSPVESVVIAEAGYDAATKTMAVKYRNGSIYHYHGIAKSGFDALMKAKSRGTHIKGLIAGKKFKKI